VRTLFQYSEVNMAGARKRRERRAHMQQKDMRVGTDLNGGAIVAGGWKGLPGECQVLSCGVKGKR